MVGQRSISLPMLHGLIMSGYQMSDEENTYDTASEPERAHGARGYERSIIIFKSSSVINNNS